MDKTRLFEALAEEESAALLGLLSRAYDEMKVDQRNSVFSEYFRSPTAGTGRRGEAVGSDRSVSAFRQALIAGAALAAKGQRNTQGDQPAMNPSRERGLGPVVVEDPIVVHLDGLWQTPVLAVQDSAQSVKASRSAI